MLPTREVRRVVVIGAATIERQLLDIVSQAGARGYNIIPCTGKGKHQVVEDWFSGHDLVRIEVLATEAVAEQIVQIVETSPLQKQYPLIVYLDTALVHVDARFV